MKGITSCYNKLTIKTAGMINFKLKGFVLLYVPKSMFLLFLMAFLTGCQNSIDKKSNNIETPAPTPIPTPTPTESPVAFTVNVDPGAGNVLAVVGTSQIIGVKVSSTIPSSGVTVAVTVTKDMDNSNVFTASNSSVAADNNVTITSLAPGVLCTATVIVTSKSTATNTKTVSFKLAAK
jgi:hypothetical protein